MLSIKVITNSSSASHYYSEADYYAKDGEEDIASEWRGAGAEDLGLKGEVQKDQFKDMLDGKLPDGTELGRQTREGDKQHKKGWDFTLSAPKSVSVLALAGGDRRLIDAHNEAVKTALSHLEERYAMTRQQVDGQIQEVDTKNLAIGSFTHTTSRAMDPQLHTHNVILNLTKRPDGHWRSVESRKMYDASTKIGQVYRNELAQRVRALGYEVESNAKKGTFDISAMPKDVRKGFSKRRQEIEKAAENYGYRTAKGMDNAAVRTRSAKHHANANALVEAWGDELKRLDYDPERDIEAAKARAADDTRTVADNAREALDFARSHLSEREATFSVDELEETALRSDIGHVTIDALEREIAKDKDSGALVEAVLAKGRSRIPAFTTPAALKKEAYTISLMQRGKGEMRPIASRGRVSAEIDDRGFTKGQASAARLLLTSKDRVVGVQGYAGTGKTYMLRSVREVAESRGFKVRGLAPTGSAAETLQEETGIESRTLASHLTRLKNLKNVKQDKKEVLIVDESSLQNTQDAADLLTFSRQTRSRVFLIGDREQLGAIEAGKPFDQLIKGGMNYATMSDIMRQKDSPQLKAAVEASIAKQPREALNQISETVKEIPNRDDRVQAIVDRIKGLSEGERKRVLVLIPDNDTRRLVNEKIREGLQLKGVVSKDEVSVTGIANRGLSRTEKGLARFYNKGDTVIFGRDVKQLGTTADTPYTVVDRSESTVTLKGPDGNNTEWNPSEIAGRAKNGVEVHERETRKIAAGDEIRWRRKDKDLGVQNTEKGKVLGVDEATRTATIDFKNAGVKDVDLDAKRNWEHDYATTVYAGQGATFDEAVIHAESWRRNLINQKSMYVALSRAKFRSHVYTDDADKLAKGVGMRPGEKTSALEGKEVNYARVLDENGLPRDLRDETDSAKEKSDKRLIDRIVERFQKDKHVDMDMEI